MNKIELNEGFVKAFSACEETSKHVFITGKAGTGKSTFLQYFKQNTKKKIAVVAPTGVAALNVNGETIHSFFGFLPDITLEKVKASKKKNKQLFKIIDAIVIDEVSMVRADLMDCIDKFLRINGKKKKIPFGGIQMIFIGDLYQLSPVVTSKEKEMFRTVYKSPYFFSSEVFKDLEMVFIEFEKIYRQSEEGFIRLLNKIRNNTIQEDDIKILNQRYGAGFEDKSNSKYFIYLTTTNKAAAGINEDQLSKLKGRPHEYKAKTEGNIESGYFPTDNTLRLKKGAQIMMLNNEPAGRWVNGTLGTIVDFHKNTDSLEDCIVVEFSDGNVEEVNSNTWDIFHYKYDAKKKALESEIIGSFTQYPLKLAWAVTIHKSQGKTFNKVIVDFGSGTFAHGQAYVALSRCTSFGGLILKKPLKKSHILMDWRVIEFTTRYQYKVSEAGMPLTKKLEILKEAIKNKTKLEIIYLKNSDEKSKRIILPKKTGEMVYKEKIFTGLLAFCENRKEERTFRVDRILEMKTV
ncbi:MAG: AAA family ATPase [Candidatus Firestonebacteria bacterium]